VAETYLDNGLDNRLDNCPGKLSAELRTVIRDEITVTAEATEQADPNHIDRKKQELRLFLILTIFLAPILSVAIVGGYGFIVWISQMLSN
jgi:nitrate reductase NapE